jgi:diguanylate cyclase (GGDEF)-like protein
MQELDTGKCLDSFSEIISILKSTNQHERAFHYVVDRIVRLFHCQTCAIVLIDRKTEYLSVENSYGLSHTFCKAFRKKVATGAVGELLWTGRTIVVHDAEQQAQLAQEVMLEHPFGSCVCVQISMLHRAMGYLHVDVAERREFKQEDVRLLQVFADVAGISLYKNQLHEENLRLDKVDHETGLLKYGPFIESLHATVEKAKDANEQLAVMILDVDNYKQIVNTYGYDASKDFLKELGDLVKLHMRSIDVGGRYGGDEIIIMMPHAGVDDAVNSARGLRKRVEDGNFTQQHITTTISIGVAAYPHNGRTMEDLLLAAKEALFEAQRAGRNKVYHCLTEWSARERALGEA